MVKLTVNEHREQPGSELPPGLRTGPSIPPRLEAVDKKHSLIDGCRQRRSVVRVFLLQAFRRASPQDGDLEKYGVNNNAIVVKMGI